MGINMTFTGTSSRSSKWSRGGRRFKLLSGQLRQGTSGSPNRILYVLVPQVIDRFKAYSQDEQSKYLAAKYLIIRRSQGQSPGGVCRINSLGVVSRAMIEDFTMGSKPENIEFVYCWLIDETPHIVIG